MDTSSELVFLFIIALLGGVLGTTAGGSWFVVFPGLIYRGLQPVIASVTTMLVLWSGNVAVSDPIKKIKDVPIRNFRFMLLACTLGGVSGAFLLVLFPHQVFEQIGPFLLLGSLILFIGYDYILKFVSSKTTAKTEFRYSHSILFILFLLGIYGAYFGAGMGMIIFILYRFYGVKDDGLLEKLATVLVTLNNGIALIIFISAGLVFWPFALVMIIGSVLGGYLGIFLGKKISSAHIKKIMIGIGAVVTLYFLNLVTLNI